MKTIDFIEQQMQSKGAHSTHLHQKFVNDLATIVQYDSTIHGLYEPVYGNIEPDILNVFHTSVCECLQVVPYSSLTLTYAKDDTSTMTLVFNHMVIRIYHIYDFERIKDILNIEHMNKEKTLYDKTLKVSPTRGVAFAVSELLIPLLSDIEFYKLQPNIDNSTIIKEMNRLKSEITTVNRFISTKTQKCQGDCTLDNIGIRVNPDHTYTFVLFDFGSATSCVHIESDHRSLTHSINKFFYIHTNSV